MKKQLSVYLFSMLFLLPACSQGQRKGKTAEVRDHGVLKLAEYKAEKKFKDLKEATFAGGCFWCTEASFERINGVVDVISGYSGGEKEYPSYRAVANKMTKHAEAIHIFYDPAIIDYQTLLEVFFVAHDPTQLNRQGPDVGPQYRSEIFYHDDEQKELAMAYMEKLGKSGKFKKDIVTKLSKLDEFWVAEGYHQNYYELNPYQGYIVSVSKPKVEKVMKTFPNLLKVDYKM